MGREEAWALAKGRRSSQVQTDELRRIRRDDRDTSPAGSCKGKLPLLNHETAASKLEAAASAPLTAASAPITAASES